MNSKQRQAASPLTSSTTPDAPPAPNKVLHGLAPVVASNTQLLILGSFPSVRSLAMQQYYAHPQNQFWRILGMLWQQDLMALPYAERCAQALAHGLGIWDVYASCQRQGSLDSAITNATVNDFVTLARQCPQLQAIAHNGGESWRHRKHSAALGELIVNRRSGFLRKNPRMQEKKRSKVGHLASIFDAADVDFDQNNSRHVSSQLALGLPVHKLPSTSPANASWSLERKLAAWREVLQLYGLCD